MKRIILLLYGVLTYLFFLVVFLALIGFLGNFVFPKTIDRGMVAPARRSILINLGLIVLFGLPHTLMARQSFKQWWTRFIPFASERSTYVLQSAAFLALLMVYWQPLPQLLWNVESLIGRGLVWGLYWLGWVVVLISTFLINHFELFGLQQVFEHFQHRSISEPGFKTPGLYRIVRHPLQLGLLMVSWITPEMSFGHVIFALGMTIYVLIGLHYEEKDLVRKFGAKYREYQLNTPKLIPGTINRLRALLSTVHDSCNNLLNYHPNILSARIFFQPVEHTKDC